MKLAIPLFGERISPHFATAPEALLVQTEGTRICSTWRIDLGRLSLAERRARFVGLGVKALLCGGIDSATRVWFEKQGIRVEDNRIGAAGEILKSYLSTVFSERESKT